MNLDSTAVKGFNTGTDFWKDTAMSYGIDEALIICGNYLDLNLKRYHSDDEKNFSRELFWSMYEAALNKTPIKILYPYSLEKAAQRLETSYYTMNRILNQECSVAISKAINESCYERNFYNLENAAWKVLLEYGFNRVNAVLAHQIQTHESDGRYSFANKTWAKSFILTPKAFYSAFMSAHATLIDGISDYVRRLNDNIVVERYALPGKEESGEFVQGYEIKKAAMVSDNEGYAIGRNPNAVDPYVCWQFMLRDGERHYNWGFYGSKQDAIDKFNARLFIYEAEKYECSRKSILE